MSETEEHVSAQIEDPERYVERRRLKSILDKREEVAEEVELARLEHAQGKLTARGVDRLVYTVVSHYIRDLRVILIKHPAGEEYWQERELGVIEIPPPDVVEVAWDLKTQRHGREWRDSHENPQELPRGFRVEETEHLKPEHLGVIGLEEFLSLSPPFSRERSVTFWVRNQGQKTHTVTKTVEIPTRISMKAFDVANEFAGEIGLDIEAEEGDPMIRSFDSSGDDTEAEMQDADYAGGPEI